MNPEINAPKNGNTIILSAICVVFALGIFLLDISTPSGVAGGVPYVILVLTSLWSTKKAFTLITAITGTLLNFLGFFMSFDGGMLSIEVSNRILAVFMIWVTTALAGYYKKTNDEREGLIRDLSHLNKELNEFTYVVSHDLKAPLRAIHNYSDFLQKDLKGTLGETQEMYLEGLGEAVCQSEAFLEDLLQLSRIGRKKVILKQVDLYPFLNTLIAGLALPKETEVLIEKHWPTISAEPTLLRQIFQNLITNALKYNKALKKRIEFGWSEKGKQALEIFIKDNGIGIEARFFEKIFMPFQRLHADSEYEGTGIGLATVSKAVSRLGWSVCVESVPEQGSTFYLTIPKKR
ncbi:MAG: hypothetical protein GXO96_11515 [Nitrospirae bacterium]|nr:hypothetical protein [Candidatus Manganitrophaceae bacterium]